MIEITFGNIAVDKLKTGAGIFIGETNKLGDFSFETTLNEVLGTLAGNENKLTENRWITNKARSEED